MIYLRIPLILTFIQHQVSESTKMGIIFASPFDAVLFAQYFDSVSLQTD